MARTVYLHIGLPKTGTTFLQTTMWENRRALRRQRFLYPGTSRMDHYHASQEVRGASPARMGRNAGAWNKLVAKLAAWDGDGLVSHEFFSMATPEQAKAAVAALAPAEVRLVVTVRSYVLQFPAVWQEALKMNSDLGFDEFMDRALAGKLRGGWSWESQDIPRVLGNWMEAVPADRITVVTVPPPGAPRGLLWERWKDAIGIDDSAFDLDVSYANESLGAAQAALLMRVKPHLSGPLEAGGVRHRWVRKYFGHEVLVPQRGERFGPRPHHVAELASRSAAARDWVQQQEVRVVGDLDDLLSTAAPDGTHPGDVPDSEIVDVAARAIEQMIRDVRDLTAERDRLRAELRRKARHQPVGGARAVARRLKRALGK
ncbi:hypothetical protein [Nocardioides pelophilus]|uniref:hypothetical protein n=1 Tax=Nocardioides pelophilus TaxID=2172019 RepID=UPI0016004B24|nr:hypothetical protein [Nocardioides pelophilus]